ncbi:MAG: type II secretion system protein M [Gammaproteobacteria bacterium]|nr:type II secretion system protein M [Gammaproteobacteria bacterium]
MTLREWYAGLAERERRTVLWGGTAAACILIVGLAWQLTASVAMAEERVERRRQDLAFIEAATPMIQSLPAARPGESLTIGLDRMARESGLAEQLAGIEPAANGAMRARFTAASFDSMMLLLARLQKERGARVESASVTATGASGLVDATLVIRGP